MCNFPEYSKSTCFGCGSCSLVCPQNCIKMLPNEEGFLYPFLDSINCISCGLCRLHCPITNVVTNIKPIFSFGYINKNENVLMDSSSGGAFSAFAEHILQNQGHVYGTAFDENMEAITILVNDKKDLSLLRGSKYVQSNTRKQYENIKNDLISGKSVLYCSTPCQVAGLKSFLKKDYSNLLTIDLFCHGTPSPLLFSKYINWLESKKNKKITSYRFRKKEYGWGTKGSYTANGTEELLISTFDPYYYSFLIGKTYRLTCYSCKYASPQRPGDISIGDFWGVHKTYPDIPNKKGVSAILINSKNGMNFFEFIRETGLVFNADFDQIANHNQQLMCPTEKPLQRDLIYSQINSLTFDNLAKKYLFFENPIITKLRPFAPSIIKKVVKYVLSFKKNT